MMRSFFKNKNSGKHLQNSRGKHLRNSRDFDTIANTIASFLFFRFLLIVLSSTRDLRINQFLSLRSYSFLVHFFNSFVALLRLAWEAPVNQLTWNALPGPGMLMGTGIGALLGPDWVGVAAPLLGTLAGLALVTAPEAVAYVTLS